MTLFTARRLASDGQSMLASWFAPDGKHLCYCLEPGPQREPHPAIPAGRYPLRLRTVGDKHHDYLLEFGATFHKGMVQICDVPKRDAIEFHIGNKIADTMGCSLPGENYVRPQFAPDGSNHWWVERSRDAYRRVYPILRDAILDGEVFLDLLPIGEPA